MTFFLGFKLSLVALIPEVIIIIINEHHRISNRLKILLSGISSPVQNDSVSTDQTGEIVVFESENRVERLELPLKEVVMIRSADNYIEVFWWRNHSLLHELIRNTLTNTEIILKPFSNMIRCHRTSIINVNFIDKVNNSSRGTDIHMKGFSDPVPVSRQYLLQVKNLLKNGLGE